MKFQIKNTKLTTGEKVVDIDLFTNGFDKKTNRPKCIFSCHGLNAALAFRLGLEKLIAENTIEFLEEDDPIGDTFFNIK